MKLRITLSLSAIALLLARVTVAQAPAQHTAPTPEAPAYSRFGADTCLSCHDDPKTMALFGGVHGNPAFAHGPFGPKQLQCEACHGPGAAHTARVPRGAARPPVVLFGGTRSTPVREQNAVCTQCHQSDLGAAWRGSAHASEQVACADCHSVHASTPTAPRERCESCHRRESTAHLQARAHPLRQGKMQCASCHSVHDAVGEKLLTRPTLNETCYQCHAEKRGPFLWEHAPASENCALCHAPHGSSQPGMLTQRGPFLCQSCHSQAGHPSIAFTPNTPAANFLVGQNCMNCHSQVHGSNHPSGSRLMR
jgi:DmsE family decaheme c-type cytochrome